jgi:hypothetical protein
MSCCAACEKSGGSCKDTPKTLGAPSTTYILRPNQSIGPNQKIVSPNGKAQLILQASDGNLVEYYFGNQAVWASNTAGQGVVRATMQSDGNFVLYDRYNNPIWSTGTQNNPYATLLIQNDGNVIVHTRAGVPIWTSFGASTNPGGAFESLNGLQGLGAAAPTVQVTTSAPSNTTGYIVTGVTAFALGVAAAMMYESHKTSI